MGEHVLLQFGPNERAILTQVLAACCRFFCRSCFPKHFRARTRHTVRALAMFLAGREIDTLQGAPPPF